VLPLEFYKFFTIWIYRVGQKSKLLILSEYVNKTEKTECEQIWTAIENEVLSDIFRWNILYQLFYV